MNGPPGLHIASDEADQVMRLARFRAEHPEVLIGAAEFAPGKPAYLSPAVRPSSSATACPRCLTGWTSIMRDPDVTTWTIPELRDVRRDLAASLGLAPPASPMGIAIRVQIAAIDAELARRRDELPGH